MDDSPQSDKSHLLSVLNFVKYNPLVVLVSLITIRFLYRKYKSSLRSYPGPFLASGSRLWKFISTYRGHTETDHIELHKKYGPVVRIAPDELSFASPLAALDIFTIGKGFHKTDFYSVFPPPENPDIFTEVREHVHANLKRAATTAYSLASMQQLSPWIEQVERFLIQKLDDYAASGQSCDLGHWLHYFAFDVLGEVAFSRSFGFLAEGKDVDNTIRTIDQSQTYNGTVGQIPWLDYFLRRNPLWQYVPFLATKNAHVTKIALNEMQKRMSGETIADRRDLLGQLLEKLQKSESKISQGDVFAIAHGAIFAGADSTASTMQTFLWNILSNPKIYEKINSEIQKCESSGGLSELITYNEAQNKLPYFQACLKEAMRVGPAVGLNICRMTPMPRAQVAGHMLPGGTRVAVNGWVLHRDKEIFGQDAEEFNPDRWLVDNDDVVGQERVKKMDRCMFQFGGGSHLCIGRHLATLEMNMVLTQVLRRYKIQLIDPTTPLTRHSSFFVVQEGLIVHMEKR